MSDLEVEFTFDANGTRHKVHGYMVSISEGGGWLGDNGSKDVTIKLCSAHVESTSCAKEEKVAMKWTVGTVLEHISGGKYEYVGEGSAPYEDDAVVPTRGHILRSVDAGRLYFIGDAQLTRDYKLPTPEVGQRYIRKDDPGMAMVSVLGLTNGYVVYGKHKNTVSPSVLTLDSFLRKYT